MIKNEIKELESYISKNHKSNGMFCLIDGAQIDHESGLNIEQTYGACNYLFKGTFEEEAYLYGPILIDLSYVDDKQLDNLFNLMKVKDSLIFLQSPLEPKLLRNSLLEKLYIEFEDGEIGILRFYDPRILIRLSNIINSEQTVQFMDGINAFYFTLNNLDYEIKNNA
ncbi:DUF4123 domain-containing protein [Acinetobacter sp. YH12025]|uniref:DUF4123 domain-containing protein n=1 Tax=Acinetobacter sp. YH12025 TaxID=2601042 RepID=UPI0015D27952|nr:DUF4123 domain-containing protein [Acinetobacter sp. YH12025]